MSKTLAKARHVNYGGMQKSMMNPDAARARGRQGGGRRPT